VDPPHDWAEILCRSYIRSVPNKSYHVAGVTGVNKNAWPVSKVVILQPFSLQDSERDENIVKIEPIPRKGDGTILDH
jgi:hypothetical protein